MIVGIGVDLEGRFDRIDEFDVALGIEAQKLVHLVDEMAKA